MLPRTDDGLAEYEIDDESVTIKCCAPLSRLTAPVEVGEIGSGLAGSSTFFKWPILGPLLFVNESSDARDHCANERTFLAYLKLSVYMAILSVAITLNFHIKGQESPSDLERRISKPLGAIFWALSLLALSVGCANYIRTVNMYSRKAAIVQSGWKTQFILGIISVAIIGTCIILLVISKMGEVDD
ncbi:hypothetical protein ESCO_002967 [Escovopsis weberi]|uniref:DUF202 domain-containing protein n=1 Tax=Escovopsis weberi TaxID=150374 RepID=A0A0M8N006_ESCWE|nr:hypothetical protein ESCO_002967 [Escovopsis weberi]